MSLIDHMINVIDYFYNIFVIYFSQLVRSKEDSFNWKSQYESVSYKLRETEEKLRYSEHSTRIEF